MNDEVIARLRAIGTTVVSARSGLDPVNQHTWILDGGQLARFVRASERLLVVCNLRQR